MRLAKSILAIGLSLTLLLTSGAMAVARGQTHHDGLTIICTGNGPVMVAVDANGQPVERAHHCPDCALVLFGFPSQPEMPGAAPVASAEPRQTLTQWRLASQTQRAARARAPPLFPTILNTPNHYTPIVRTTQMPVLKPAAAIAVLLLGAAPALSDIVITDAYARAATPNAKAGAAFMMIANTGETDDRLIAATSPAAQRVELHTHMETGDGVMKMMEVEAGFSIPAGGMHKLARGGDHVMFMGLTDGWSQGDMIPVTLIFEQAGARMLEIMVDLERQPEGGHGGHGDHGHSGHGSGMDHSHGN